MDGGEWRTNFIADCFCSLTGHKEPAVCARAGGRAKIGLAADENDGDLGTTNVADLFDPLGGNERVAGRWGAYLVGDIVERVGGVNGKGNEDDMCFCI